MAMRHDTLERAGTFDAGMPQWGSALGTRCHQRTPGFHRYFHREPCEVS